MLYCKFWRGKILKNGDGGGGNKGAVEVEFPEALCKRIAGITDGFSFAYLQEAFVGALLAIAAEDDGDDDDDDGNGAEVGNGNENADEDEFELVGEAVQEQRDEAGGGDGEGGDDNDIEKLVLWKAIQKQVEVSHGLSSNKTETIRNSMLTILNLDSEKRTLNGSWMRNWQVDR